RGRRPGRARGAPARLRGRVARRGVRGGPRRRVLAGSGGAARQLAPRRRVGARDGRRLAPPRARELGPGGQPQLRLGAVPERRLTPDQGSLDRPGWRRPALDGRMVGVSEDPTEAYTGTGIDTTIPH